MARGKLPKWAIKKAGGINKKAWRLARAGGKVPSVRHPNVVLTLGLHPTGETWHEEKW